MKLLNLNLLLLALRRVGFFVLFKQKFAEVHDSTNRRFRGRRHFDEIEGLTGRQRNRFGSWHHP